MELTPPPGASAGLKAFIAMAEEAIQTAVDLLGRGTPDLPPNVDDLLRPVIYESIGDSLMKEQYQEAIAKVEARQTALLTYDTKVMKTSIVVAAGSDETLRAIKAIVAELQAKLKAAGSGKLKPAQEVALMKLVAQAIDLVYDKVEAVYQLNNDMAGNGQGSNGSGSGGGSGQSGSGGSGGGGGGDGGLGQLVSMLGMLPMMAMPLISQLPELLKQQDKDKDKDKDKDAAQDGAQPGEGQPQAAAPGAAPGSPAPAAAPGAGQPAAAAAASASTPGSATPVANTSGVSARTNVRRAVNRTGSTPTDSETDETQDTDPDDEVTVDSPVVQA
ncbi:hypothetical protein [Nocardia sp. CA-135398]|uniref:hypothetical protein n=1 Tax=Nocardia sp. CA-135398 TaxID=3239977 RepID=UPI003D978012